MHRRTLALPAMAAAVATALAACQGGPVQGGGGDDRIVVGSTDDFTLTKESPAPFDPAAAYDIGSWSIMRNTFDTLLRLPRSGTEPEMSAAKKCQFTDRANEQYRCTLRSGLKFSNGRELTAADVKFSIERSLAIGWENGPKSLLSNIDHMEVTNESEIVFHLRTPDATFPYKLSTPAAAIVDSDTYPAKSLLKGHEIVGSGPYVLESFDPEAGKAVLDRNPHYEGQLEIENSGVEVRFFADSGEMEKALTAGDIDVMNRSMTPEQVTRLTGSMDDDIEVVESAGQEIRYLVFTTDAEPVRERAVRQAFAQLVDRQALVRDVYQRTAEPLYSLVPTGVLGHRNSFFNIYGAPSVDAARATLKKAGVKTPVQLELTYTTDHYGTVTAKEFQTLSKQLNSSGLFQTTVTGVPWSEFRPAAAQRDYAVYGMGWFPDFPDPDNYVAPFFGKDNFLNTPYQSKVIRDQVIPETRRTAQRSATSADFNRVQDIVAHDVPLLPLWQSKQYVAAGEDITGTEWALNSSSVLQLWELGRRSEG